MGCGIGDRQVGQEAEVPLIRAAIEAVESAGEQAAPRLTAILRYSALQAGWDPAAVGSLVVEAERADLSVSGSDDALAEEYGDLETRPKPAVRQFSNRRSSIDEQVARAIESRIGGLL